MNWRSKASLLVAMISLLTGCSNTPVAYCPMPVSASPEVRAWLKDKEPFPEYMRQYLKAVGDEQEAIKKNCFR